LAKLDTSRLDIYATYPLTQLLTQPGATIIRDRLKTKLIIVASIMIFGMLSLALTLTQMRKTLIHNNDNYGKNKKKSFDKYNALTKMKNSDVAEKAKVDNKKAGSLKPAVS